MHSDAFLSMLVANKNGYQQHRKFTETMSFHATISCGMMQRDVTDIKHVNGTKRKHVSTSLKSQIQNKRQTSQVINP